MLKYKIMETNKRTAGILLHITSLPGTPGIGTMGAKAYDFVNWLEKAGQHLWQVLPIGPTGYGDSPYASFSTFAGNPLLIDLDDLVARNWATAEMIKPADYIKNEGPVDYGSVVWWKIPVLKNCAVYFMENASKEDRQKYEAFKNDEVSRIILTRPAVEAGESLGFLPGDMKDKVDPYLRPLYDALYQIMGAESFLKNMEKGLIEVAPLAYMRGRTLDNAYIILDEAQNTTSGQMRMFLTRIGESSTAVITGDPTQIDLPKKSDSGFTEAMNILCGIESLSVVRFSHRDTVRSRIVREIVKAYSLEENDGK